MLSHIKRHLSVEPFMLGKWLQIENSAIIWNLATQRLKFYALYLTMAITRNGPAEDCYSIFGYFIITSE